MNFKSFDKLELNKILYSVSEYAVTDGGKKLVIAYKPSSDLEEVRRRLSLTSECDKLLYKYGTAKVLSFIDMTEELTRVNKGSSMTCAELLSAAELLRAARTAYSDIEKTDKNEIVLVRSLTKNICFDEALEKDITEKIISVDTLSDYASDRLFSIRSKIKSLNSRIREKLSEYTSGKYGEYLQDSIVTVRNDRYVIPVKAEHKSHVKGFIHDRSKTGATFFIEPEYILELNNELIALTIYEKEETEAILRALSKRLGDIAENLIETISILFELDGLYARAEFSYAYKCSEPKVNNRGYINIVKGRHPLVGRDECVPVSIELGGNYAYLLLSGANTGGKTVTMKMTGLLCLMASCGLFIPAAEGSSVAVFKNVYCDIGDSQSIEASLSTFSSHLTNVIQICNNAGKDSLVLIDELGGGTDPDEGQAIARAVVEFLVNSGSKGIVTTHFTSLKEFAYSVGGIENACMEFDTDTLKPLYQIKIGLPGASNALSIAKRLGMNGDILSKAESYLSDGARSFENVVQKAEESRIEAEKRLSEISLIKSEWQDKLNAVNKQIDELNRERAKINRSARTESRRIIAERTEKAEEILAEIEELFHKEELKETDLITARTLRNKIKDTAFEEDGDTKKAVDFLPATVQNIKTGIDVFIKPMDCRGTVTGFNAKKCEAEVSTGSFKLHINLKDLLIIGEKSQTSPKVKIVKSVPRTAPVLEINVLGMAVQEALYEVDNFIDRAVTDNLEEVKIIHGVGTGKLRKSIHERLKKHKNVESFRLGKYGEGETGVTFIKLR